mmetsp:Transcript_71996/g.204319  ORF Transcript_71996/g.204319 Transcript_71996/m.204319 type:complete len:93 (-) Transcript_71996:426-704(-)
MPVVGSTCKFLHAAPSAGTAQDVVSKTVAVTAAPVVWEAGALCWARPRLHRRPDMDVPSWQPRVVRPAGSLQKGCSEALEKLPADLPGPAAS